MAKVKLLVTRQFPKAVLERANRDYDCLFNQTSLGWSNDELILASQNMQAIFCSSSDKFTDDIISKLSDTVKIIATFSVGYEHFDLNSAKARGITLTNTPDVVTESTADTAILLMLAAARRAREAFSMIVSDSWKGWTPTQLLGIQPRGRRLGILGMGRIGRAVAQRARSFGMEIHYHNRNKLSAELEDGAIYHAASAELFKISDFLSINCELTKETSKLLNQDTINLLPENAIVVNTSRGGVIDDKALISALKSGQVFAAGLDVFDGEPNINPDYLSLKNVFLFPHIGSATIDARNAMGFRALDNIDSYFKSGEPKDKLV